MDLSALNGLLFSIHTILAAVAKTPELALSKEESESIAKAAANVAQHYDLAASAKTLAWTNLAMCCGMVYGTRALAISARLKEQKRNSAKVIINPMTGDTSVVHSAGN